MVMFCGAIFKAGVNGFWYDAIFGYDVRDVPTFTALFKAVVAVHAQIGFGFFGVGAAGDIHLT